MNSKLLTAGTVAASLLISSSVIAATGPNAQIVQLASGHLTKEQVVDRVFTNVERRILERYYEARERQHRDEGRDRRKNKGKNRGKGKNTSLPPGLAKRGGNLPPGLAKRGGDLPPGLAKRLPTELRDRLPTRPPRFRRVVVDNDIVLIDAVTNKVLDVLENVVVGSR